MSVGYVIFDSICLVVGAVGLRGTVNSATIEAVATAAAPVMSKIEGIIAKMVAQDASKTDVAWGVFQILQVIYSGGSLGAVFSAFTASLTWWDLLLYGISGTATIIAALATDGVALVAEIVVLLATFGFLVSDSVKVVQTCGLATAAPDSQPISFEPVIAIQTSSGGYLTVVENGGLGGGDVAIVTNSRVVGDFEKFTVVPLDQEGRTFALQTFNGNYVTAVNGGDMGGPNDATCPVHTDGSSPGPWQQLSMDMQDDGTFAISTSTGYYLTAVNGGGFGEAPNLKPIHTDTRTLGGWEILTIVPISG
jgi:hypothetical protein